MRSRRSLKASFDLSPKPYSATWEIRCGPKNRYRVFYEVDSEEREVLIIERFR